MSQESKTTPEYFIAKYPLCFNEGLPRSGFYAPLGWHDLLHKTFSVLEFHLEHSVKPEDRAQFFVVQVKEKFGTLRLYFNKSDAFINGVVCLAESLTQSMCDVCGKPGQLTQQKSVVMTRCDLHK